jgi:hypothetical protein
MLTYWSQEVARLQQELQHATEKLTYEVNVRDIRAEHARIAEQRNDWQWIAADEAELTGDIWNTKAS